MNATLFWSIIGLASIFLILKSASFALDSIIRYARKTKLSHYFVGLLIVSLGTSLPEFFTAVISSLEGNPALVLGDAMGATIVDITLVLAMVAIVAGKVKAKHETVDISWWKVLAVVSIPLLLAIDGKFSRIDGLVMVAAFLAYYGISIYYEVKKQKAVKNIPLNFTLKETFIFGINIAMLIFGVQLLVMSSSNLAGILNIPMYLFGAVFLSICTTSPEFVIELKAILSKSAPIAFGDIFGSVICNTSLVLGIATLISPITIDRVSFYSVGIIMLIVVAISMYFMEKELIRRWQGILLFMFYLLFLAVQISMLMGKGLFYGVV
jgi:cation:H+ antiporter